MPSLRHLQSASLRLKRGLSLRGAAVALILAMHVLGLYFLLLPPRQLKQYTEVAFMTLMPPRPQAQTPPLPMLMPPAQAQARRRAPARASGPSMPLAQPEAAPAAPEAIAAPAGEVPAVPAGDDLRTRARKSAGSIDKALRTELRKDKPWLAEESAAQGGFRTLLASAYRGGAVLTVDDYLTADGRPASRVRTPAGSTCYAMDENPGAGADPFKTGGKVKRVPCPH